MPYADRDTAGQAGQNILVVAVGSVGGEGAKCGDRARRQGRDPGELARPAAQLCLLHRPFTQGLKAIVCIQIGINFVTRAGDIGRQDGRFAWRCASEREKCRIIEDIRFEYDQGTCLGNSGQPDRERRRTAALGEGSIDNRLQREAVIPMREIPRDICGTMAEHDHDPASASGGEAANRAPDQRVVPDPEQALGSRPADLP